MNKINSMEKKIINSKFNVTKNFLYYMIAPLVIIIVGIILISTVGFNLGADFTGSSSFKIYVNNEATFEHAEVYDLEDIEDYNTVYGKVKGILDDNGLKIVSVRTSTINLMSDYNVPDGQAIEVVFQNSSTYESKINAENEEIRKALLVEFDYSSVENAITSVDYSPMSQNTFNWAIGILAAVVFGAIVAIIYMMFRFDKSAWIVVFMQVALDILLFIALLSIFRLTVNLTVGIAILATFTLTILNSFVYYSKMKGNIKSGKYANKNNKEMANELTKETLLKRIFVYALLFIMVFVLAIVAVEGVREVALAISIGLLVTLFTSIFFTPSIWSVMYKEKKKINC